MGGGPEVRLTEVVRVEVTWLYVFCRWTLTEVAVSRQRHQVGVQEMLVAHFIWAVVVHAHLKQGVVLLLHSYNACRRDKKAKQQMAEKKYFTIQTESKLEFNLY